METFEGKWTQVKQENFDDYLKACGVSFLLRKVAGAATASIEFRKNADGSWTYLFFSTVKNGQWIFRVGEESEETTPDGRKMMSTITVENGKLTHKQRSLKPKDYKDSVVERWIENGELHTTCSCDGVVSKCVDAKQ